MEFLGTVGFHLLLVLPCLLGESQAILWTGSLQNGDIINTCREANVAFPWQYRADGEDVVNDIQWYFDGRSQEVIAMFTHGYFQAYPAFSGRVSRLDNAGLVLFGVLPEDSGSYTVVVKGHNASGQYFELNTTVVLQVSDQIMNQHGNLHVSKAPEPVKDSVTGQWAIQLLCGVFTFPGKPTYDVQWIHPFGHLLNSSGFDGMNFSLMLTSPFQGGYFTCRVPHQNSCVNGQGMVSAEASILVDSLDARLSVLEKLTVVENQQLRTEKEQLELRLNETAEQLQDLQEREKLAQSETNRRLESVTWELGQLTSDDNGTIVYLQGPVRLVGGSNETEGRVEWRVGSRWGTICDDDWDNADAKVVCNMLGYFASGAQARMRAFFGQGSGPIVLDDVRCNGTESDLRLCQHRDFGTHDCQHIEDAGVVCAGY